MADLVSPIVDIISRLWPCCARHTSYLCKLQENKILLRNAMKELTDARNDVLRTVIEAEADLNEPKMRTDSVSGWLQSVQIIERQVEEILQKADEQLRRARSCLGVCCPPNNCWSNYKLGKSIAKKIPFVEDLKVKGDFQERYVARPTNYLSKLQENKILLRSAMAELKEARDDVQRRIVAAEADPNEPKKRTDPVSGWLQRVETIEGEVEVILQTSDEQFSNEECHENDKLVVMKKASVDELMGKGRFEELTYILPQPSVQNMNLESTVGMESMFYKVWRLITSKDHIVSIMGLYGIGGVGKTTLLEKINNEFKKICTGEHGFDHIVMFVVVSKPINYEAIQKKIGERLGLSNSLQGDGDESSRADKIFNVLSNKNFVILLDDIWERVDLRRIGIPIIHPQGKSKLIFTTRSERVCGEMEATHTFQVECLPWDKAWSLFQEKVGEKALNSFLDARELAKDVAKECGGLPLALITIGRAMSTKKTVQEWRDAIATLRRYASKFQDMRDKVLPRLKLSYDNLPNETEKSCFRYCALFPEDYSIKITKLVDYWIAEGFLDGFDNKLDEARNRGHTIIGSLKSACLLESSDEENHVKMHDVIRDLAIWIVNDCRSTDESGSTPDNKYLVAVNDPCKKWENATRIFWDATHYTTSSSSSNNNEEENPPTSPNLLTFIMVRKMNAGNDLRLSPSFFQHMPLLRVLDLSNISLYTIPISLYTIPISICELHELQYLNLSVTDIEELPVELRKLVKLKFLVLHDTSALIPAGVIENLSKLQVLDLGGVENWELKGGPSFSELDGLKQLQEVRISIKTDVALEKFLCNRKLQMVCTGLSLNNCKKSRLLSSRRVLDLNKFKSLKYMLINELLELEELVLYGGLLSTLERLSLHGVSKLNNILWMGRAQPDDLLRPHSQSLEIFIIRCDALKDLRWLVHMENLKTLYVRNCKGLETIIEFDGGGDGDGDGLEGGAQGGDQILLNRERVFRRLERLIMCGLPKLKSICRYALAFPSIENINISKCPKLKKLPLGSGSNVNNTLKEIEGERKWWNAQQWKDETIKSKFLPYYKEVVRRIVVVVVLNKWKGCFISVLFSKEDAMVPVFLLAVLSPQNKENV